MVLSGTRRRCAGLCECDRGRSRGRGTSRDRPIYSGPECPRPGRCRGAALGLATVSLDHAGSADLGPATGIDSLRGAVPGNMAARAGAIRPTDHAGRRRSRADLCADHVYALRAKARGPEDAVPYEPGAAEDSDGLEGGEHSSHSGPGAVTV